MLNTNKNNLKWHQSLNKSGASGANDPTPDAVESSQASSAQFVIITDSLCETRFFPPGTEWICCGTDWHKNT